MKPLALEESEVLFGSDPLQGIVAVEPLGDSDHASFPSAREKAGSSG